MIKVLNDMMLSTVVFREKKVKHVEEYGEVPNE